MQRLGREQRVEGINSERRGAAGPGSAGEPCQIGEVAHAPIARTAQTVELAGQAPAAGTPRKLFWEVATGGGNDQAEPCGNVERL